MKNFIIFTFVGVSVFLTNFSFTQASPIVDLTIAGSEGPVYVRKGDTIAVTWSSENTNYCIGNGLGWNGQTYGQWGQKNLPTSGIEFFSPNDNPGFSGTISFSIVCWNSNKTELGEDTENAVVFSAPSILSFSPLTGSAGTKVSIHGNNLENITKITFIDKETGKINFLEYSPTSNTQVNVSLPSILTGRYYIEVTTSFGSAKSSDYFTFVGEVLKPTGTIYASPNPCNLNDGDQCLTNLIWSTQNVSAASVLLGDGKIVFNGINGNQSTRSGYVYYLYDYSSGSKGSLLDSVDVQGIRKNVIISPIVSTPIFTPAVTPFTSTPDVTSSNNLSPLFSRNMWQGITGSDVKKLQQLLNLDINTRIVESGVGSTGQESTYFGFLTQVAVQNFQCKYNIICSGSPDTTGYGVVGPSTRLKLEEVFSNDKNISVGSSSVISSSSSTSSLTKSQIDSILGLLTAFGADQTIIENVKSVLSN